MVAVTSPTAPEGQTYLAIEGPERRMALGFAKAGLVAAPVLVAAGGLGWGWAGASSVGYALAIVVANFCGAALLQGFAARYGAGALMGAVLGGYLLRLGVIAGAVLAVKDAGWVDLVPLCLALVVSHLGLLGWEAKQVSFSLASTPGDLKAAAAKAKAATPPRTVPSPTKPSPTAPATPAPTPNTTEKAV